MTIFVRFARRLKRSKALPDFAAAQKTYQQKLTEYAREAATRSLLRDLYSKNQLKEQLTWFWMNHFNVSQNKGEIRALVGDYEENAIRPHVLGKFRDLLIATVFHPAMLQYLDNAQNAAGHINENYAREIMELHTMGVGSGYTQKDVQELARILTGVGVKSPRQGCPMMRRNLRSEYPGGKFVPDSIPIATIIGDKIFLGTPIKGAGLTEIARGNRHPERGNRPPRITSAASWRNISAATHRRIHWSTPWPRPSATATAISPQCCRRCSPHRNSKPRWVRSSRTRCIMRSRRCAPLMASR